MVKVKICGITSLVDLRAAVDAGADALGFVVGTPYSPRNLQPSEAKNLISEVPRSVSSVAVTVLKDMEKLKQLNELDADYLQLHGGLHHFLGSITELPSKKRLIGSVDAQAANALELAVEYSGIFDSILLDTAGDDYVGGTGITHNWDLSRTIRDTIHPTPLILAGGLTPENVSEAIRRVKPYGVDVSSGVEEKPGIKDREKMFEFVANVKEGRS